MAMELVSHKSWYGHKEWVRLRKIPHRGGPIFWISDPITQKDVHLLTFDEFVDEWIENKVLAPGQPVKGWVFYEAPPGYDDGGM